MTKKKAKSKSFDAMIKFFMRNYDIPTKKDIAQLMLKMDRIEKMIESIPDSRRKKSVPAGKTSSKNIVTASDTVLRVIKMYGNDGASFADIKASTGFEDKKLRNIIFRMDKTGKIFRKKRGIYIVI